VFLRHSFFQICKNLAIDVEGSFAGEAHEFEFVRRFARATGDGDGISGDAFVGRGGGAEMIEEGEGETFFDADAAGAKVAVGESCGEEFPGVLVFLPDADFGGEEERFTHAGFFESGSDEDGFAAARDEESKKAFAEPPVDAGEVVKRGTGAYEERVEFWTGLRH